MGDSSGNIGFVELDTRACDRSDFNFGDGQDTSSTQFYPSKETDVDEIKNFLPNLICLKEHKDLYISGNYDTFAAEQIMIVFEKCDPDNLPPQVLEC